jgi:hypothetical protein
VVVALVAREMTGEEEKEEEEEEEGRSNARDGRSFASW